MRRLDDEDDDDEDGQSGPFRPGYLARSQPGRDRAAATASAGCARADRRRVIARGQRGIQSGSIAAGSEQLAGAGISFRSIDAGHSAACSNGELDDITKTPTRKDTFLQRNADDWDRCAS